jgi:hypothetical protein
MRRRLNMYLGFPEEFKEKFGRMPKVWTIEEVHDLWLRTLERYNKKRDITRALWNEIIKGMSPEEKEPFSIYYEDNEENKITKYTFSWSESWDGYGVSTDWNGIKFSDNPKKAREEKIDFIINNEKAFEYGERYHKVQEENKEILSWIVQETLFNMIDEKLREHFKNTDEKPKQVFKIKISDKQYYITASGDGLHSKRAWTKFEFGGAVEEGEIKLEGSLGKIW